ncbi:hypothetical protein [Acanthopleuribacter pedis]|uniref:Uncharacterized protein n=1 Tax=Acanthopleuribacter pedis TaxID=442870 RepID=A0A8J7QF99_9BACT|nr:hypothetical protein [Acanthopleuribacter pedis]MBO1319586.1 hypothetical protein [Acanthopleuribacter pedis]
MQCFQRPQIHLPVSVDKKPRKKKRLRPVMNSVPEHFSFLEQVEIDPPSFMWPLEDMDEGTLFER